MIIFPAIDLRHGKCVRLLRGDPNLQTTYADDPIAVAANFEEAGAEWLHVVNLDGALDDETGARQNKEAIQAILDRVTIPVQVGGGIRTIQDIEVLLDMGITRVILGTMAVERTRQLPDIMGRFGPKQVIAGLDARNGKIATHGWQTTAELNVPDFGKKLHAIGFTHAVYTDISRDGALTGINLTESQTLGQQTGLQVIISGGVAGLDDVKQAAAATDNIHGLIIGRALYTGNITLPDALKAAQK